MFALDTTSPETQNDVKDASDPQSCVSVTRDLEVSANVANLTPGDPLRPTGTQPSGTSVDTLDKLARGVIRSDISVALYINKLNALTMTSVRKISKRSLRSRVSHEGIKPKILSPFIMGGGSEICADVPQNHQVTSALMTDGTVVMHFMGIRKTLVSSSDGRFFTLRDNSKVITVYPDPSIKDKSCAVVGEPYSLEEIVFQMWFKRLYSEVVTDEAIDEPLRVLLERSPQCVVTEVSPGVHKISKFSC